MQATEISSAAEIILSCWNARTTIEALPANMRPHDRAEGYAVQAALAAQSGDRVVGWKIAATSVVGQQHIGVDGPLAGRLLARQVLFDAGSIAASGAGTSLLPDVPTDVPTASPTVPLTGNLMRVAEAEFVFRLGQPLPSRSTPYTLGEVSAAVSALHLGIEVPDSRFSDFAHAGMGQLIADNACTDWFVLGEPVASEWRSLDLAAHKVTVRCDGRLAAEGVGANVLGSPWFALVWLVNELSTFGPGLLAGEIVTTGTCITPIPIRPGQRIEADFGVLGRIAARLT